MPDFLSDVRYAWRMLRSRPGFAALIVVTLGVGIGANSAIFSVVHALLLQPFPFKDPDRLVRVATVKGGEEGPLAIPELDDLQALSQVVEKRGRLYRPGDVQRERLRHARGAAGHDYDAQPVRRPRRRSSGRPHLPRALRSIAAVRAPHQPRAVDPPLRPRSRTSSAAP